MSDYNHTEETKKHIRSVQAKMATVIAILEAHSQIHDYSKLLEPEKGIFEKHGTQLKHVIYGTKEYEDLLIALKPGLEHHYGENSHHPEHFPNHLNGMSLIDVVEMFCDWCAAIERHKDGNIFRSLEYNRIRWKIDPQLYDILYNTALALGYKERE